jgi:hypothetical protein
MKLWADWLADNPRDYARCPGLTYYHRLTSLPTVFVHVPTASRADRRLSINATYTPTSTRHNFFNMTLIEEAIAAIKSRELEDDLVYQ